MIGVSWLYRAGPMRCYERALEGCERVKEDLERAQERTDNALRLIEDAL
jgi:hypothetical protein